MLNTYPPPSADPGVSTKYHPQRQGKARQAVSTVATSRTGTAEWKQLVKQAKAEAIDQGLNTCPLCNTWLDFKHHGLPNSPELDHIIEHSMGGTDEPHNLRIICRACNGKRGGKLGNAKMRQRRASKSAAPIDAKPSFDW